MIHMGYWPWKFLRRKNRTSSKPSLGYAYQFPFDHGAHNEFLTELVVLYRSSLFKKMAKRFGYELTFFRRAIDDERVWANPTRWAVRQLYFAHFAVTG